MKGNSLQEKSIVAVAWSAIEALLKHGSQFIISIVLARLILPEDFGTVALLYLFMGLAAVFMESGFSSALIQKKNVTYHDECTVFWTNLVLGTLATITLFSLAPLIASFYDVPILKSLTQAVSIVVLVNSIGAIHNTLFVKALDFKKLTFINSASTIVSGATAIGMALKGYGVYALVAQSITNSVVTNLLLWAISKWRPAFIFSHKSFRELFSFGSYLLLSAILNTIYVRLYTVILGRFYTVKDLAFYNRADNTYRLPTNILSSLIARVAFPVFSSANNDMEKLRRGLKVAIQSVMLINIPLMLGLMVTADKVVMILFGENWLPAIPMLKILCIAGIFWPIHMINLEVIKALGRSELFFRLEIIKKVIGTALLFCGMPWGPIGIAWSQVAAGIFGFAINTHYSKLFLNYGALSQFRDFFPALVNGIFMACLVGLLGLFINLPSILTLALQVVLGFIFYSLVCYIFKFRALYQCVDLYKGRT